MSKTKFDKIIGQQKKARNKEILYRVEQILYYDKTTTINILLDIVTLLHQQEPSYLHPFDVIKHFPPGYKIIDEALDNEVTNNE